MRRGLFGIFGATFAIGATLLAPRAPDSAIGRSLRSQAPQRQTPSAGAIANLAPPCPSCAGTTEAAGPWQAACGPLQIPSSSARAPSSSSPSSPFSCIPRDANLRSLIATVPDPQRTNLALYFDRTLESLILAAGSSGYTLERFWLPWSSGAEKDLYTLADRDLRRQEVERRRSEPGLLVFGHATGPGADELFIFLVAESPTSGLDPLEFEHALAYVGQLPAPANLIEIVGPAFSGSLRPLAEDLSRSLRADVRVRFHLVSGAVTGSAAIRDFREAMAVFGGRLEYESVVENDTFARTLFLRYLANRRHSPSKLAILTEDQTVYGAISQNPEHELIFRYPRQIARLRNAYQEAGVPEAGSAQQASEGVHPSLKNSPDDGRAPVGKDMPEAFSHMQSPVSQDAVLLSISADIGRERVDLAGIVATDVLDSLFLTRFLRLSNPDVRIFALDADLLFIREGETAPFTGVLTVTSYPLIGRNQYWTHAGSHERLPFASRYAEGTYNAAQTLLHGKLVEYSSPLQPLRSRPPLWLTVIGRDGYWPVALLDDGISQSTTRLASILKSSGKFSEEWRPEYPARGWYLCFWIVILFASLHSVYVFYLLCLRPGTCPSKVGLPFLPRYANRLHLWLRRRQAGDGRAARAFRILSRLLRQARGILRAAGAIFATYPSFTSPPCGPELPFLGAATLASACLLLLLSSSLLAYRFSAPASFWVHTYEGVAIAVLALLLSTAIAVSLRSFRRSGFSRFCLICFSAWTAAILFSVFVGRLVLDTSFASGLFFAYRSLSLGNGVSPAIPLLLLTTGFVYWAWIHLRRESMIALRREIRECGSRAPADAERHIARVMNCIENIFSENVWRPAVLFMFLWLLLLQPWRTLRSFESQPYDLLFIGELALLYWLMTVCWTQFFWCWKHFKKFLEFLERFPIRDAFSRLHKETAWLPLVSSVKDHQLLITTHSAETLKALCNFNAELLPLPQRAAFKQLRDDLGEFLDEVERITAELEGKLGEGHAAVDTQRYARLQTAFDKAAVRIDAQLAEGEWARGRSESLQRERELKSGEKEISPEQQLLVLEEEFIALRYLIFIRYVFRHLRNLLSFVVVAFILSVIALQSYPFEGRRWIGLVSVFVFAALGIGIGIVFAQMDRDALISRITDTRANQVGRTFLVRMVQFGALPLLTVLSSQFPFINRFIFDWLRPALDALR